MSSTSSRNSDARAPSPAGRKLSQDNEKAGRPATHDDLKDLGYEQQMPRSRGLLHILFMSISIMTPIYGLAAPLATSLIGGGPATMIWGWVLIACLTQTLAWSMGEICSKYPTSAGAYYWCFRLASPKYRVILSWINGWLTLVGVWTISLSVTFGTAQIIVAGINIFHPEWIAMQWQTYVIFLGVTLFVCLVCITFNRHLPVVDTLCAVWTIIALIVILVCLTMKAAAGRRTAAYALSHFDPSNSGWTPGWTFFTGLLPAAYTFSAVGMVTNMSEEVVNPTVNIPRAMSLSIPIGAVCGLVFLLPIVFTLPDIATLLTATSGQPIGLLFELVMGSQAGGFGLWFVVLGTALFCAISICTAASRATWAFARDKAIPGHRFFSQVSHRLGDIPLHAFLLSTFIQLLLGLINLGSTAAFNAFVGVGVICLGASYAMPVFISLLDRRRQVQDAPYSLGKRMGFVINGIAVLWILFATILFCMPAVVPVTRTSMNYASVVFVGFGVISAAWYFIGGRKKYVGPIVPINLGHTSTEMAKNHDL